MAKAAIVASSREHLGDKREPKRLGSQRREMARRRARLRRRLRVAIPVGAVVVIAVVAVTVSFVGSSSPGRPLSGPVTVSGPARATLVQAGERVPDFTAPSLTGGHLSWDSYRGRPVVLALWAPWCPHCQRELPILSQVAGALGVDLVTIVTSVGSAPGPSPEGYMRSHGLSFPVAMDNPGGRLAEAFGLSSFPTVYYVNADGTVRQSAVGEVPEAEMRAAMEAIAGS